MEKIELIRKNNDIKKSEMAENNVYGRKGIVFETDKAIPFAEEYTFCAEFKDDMIGYGMLNVNGISCEAYGFTSCNTGRIRTATFVWKPKSNDEIKPIRAEIFGMSGIIRLTVSAGRNESLIELAKADRAKPGEVKPGFYLKSPIQLINTVGADAPQKEDLPMVLERMKEECPYIKALGFNGVESYVKWNFIEYEKGKYDWSFYDAVINLAAEYGLKWFPLIIGGSAYALPEWYHDTEGFTGFKCLEHGEENNVPTIFNDHQTPYIIKYLHEFGKHYEGNKNVFGIRLGPSGNYGESQYPATGNWGYKGQKEHMHIGWWANDKDANGRFSKWLKDKYSDVEKLNSAWNDSYSDFSEIRTFMPVTAQNKRKRKDFVDWYMYEMTSWCDKWGVWVRDELKSHDIYQSAGGWGFCDVGTDFTDQTAGMVPIKGGIRATNEDESYELNFAITRMLSSSARFYSVPFGSEPAGYGTARSVINRLFNIIVNNGSHLFYYSGGFSCCDETSDLWLKYAPLIDNRSKPIIDVAVLYPDTQSKLFESSIRFLDSSSFFSQVFPLRRKLDYDYCSERMVLENALEKNKYKALVFLARSHDGDYYESEVLNKIDEWVKDGGTVIYPLMHSNVRQGPVTVEDTQEVFERWRSGNTGKGRVIFIHAMREPLDDYIDNVAKELKKMSSITESTKFMLNTQKPRRVYMSVLENGKTVIYNDYETEKTITLPDGKDVKIAPLSITML